MTVKIISEKIRTPFWISLIVIVHLTFSYYLFNGWWYSAAGTAGIILISWVLWKERFPARIGLNLSRKQFIFSIFISLSAVIFSYLMMQFINRSNRIDILYSFYGNYIHDIFYTLNEEIVLGSLVLFYLTEKTRIHRLLIAASLAVIFSLIHFVFYKWIFLQQGLIEPLTLLTLFLIGFFRNNLILTFRHVGYSWAFHFAWMAVMFGSYHYHRAGPVQLNEPERFNRYLGSIEMSAVTLVLAAISMFLFNRKTSSAQGEL